MSLMLIITLLSFIGGMYGTGISCLKFCGSFSAFKLIQWVKPRGVMKVLFSNIKEAKKSITRAKEKLWQQRIRSITSEGASSSTSPMKLLFAEEELAKVVVVHKNKILDHVVSIIGVICLMCMIIFLPALALTLKMAQLKFAIDTPPNQWSLTQYIIFFGFLIQLSSITDERILELRTIMNFIYANEDGILDDQETRRMGMMDHMIKELLVTSGFWGFIHALCFDLRSLSRLVLKPPTEDEDWTVGLAPEKIGWLTADFTYAYDKEFILLRWSVSPFANDYRVEYRIICDAVLDENEIPINSPLGVQYVPLDNAPKTKNELSCVTFQIYECDLLLGLEHLANEIGDSYTVKFRVVAISEKGTSEPSVPVSALVPFERNETHGLGDPRVGDASVVQLEDGFSSIQMTHVNINRGIIRWSPIFMYEEAARKDKFFLGSGETFEAYDVDDADLAETVLQPGSPKIRIEDRATVEFEEGKFSSIEIDDAVNPSSYRIRFFATSVGEIAEPIAPDGDNRLTCGCDTAIAQDIGQVYTNYAVIKDPVILETFKEWQNLEHDTRHIVVERLRDGVVVASFKTCFTGTNSNETRSKSSSLRLKPEKTHDVLMPFGNIYLDNRIHVSRYPRFNVGDFIVVKPDAGEYLRDRNTNAAKQKNTVRNIFQGMDESSSDLSRVMSKMFGVDKGVYEIGRIDGVRNQNQDSAKTKTDFAEPLPLTSDGFINTLSPKDSESGMESPKTDSAALKAKWVYDVSFDSGERVQGLPTKFIDPGFFNQVITIKTMKKSGFNLVLFFLFLVLSSGTIYFEAIRATRPDHIHSLSQSKFPRMCRQHYDLFFWVNNIQLIVLLSGIGYTAYKFHIRRQWMQYNVYPSDIQNALLRIFHTTLWILVISWGCANGVAMSLFVNQGARTICLPLFTHDYRSIVVANVTQIVCACVLGFATLFRWCLRHQRYLNMCACLNLACINRHANSKKKDIVDYVDDESEELCWKRDCLCWRDPIKGLNSIF